MTNPAIKIENLSKQYRLGVVGTGTLAHDLKRWWAVSVMRGEDPYLKIGEANLQKSRGQSQYVWALKDINLEVQQGEVLGIIGRNGAGKSTLLKILSRVTRPTTGTLSYRGRIASLLEVGTGFHPEMTGRENIFMNGSIMGMTKAEIRRKFDEIVDFAGVERYIDTPVKRYSSGMTVRLGFAVAAHLEPEILVVDEVLAVGDAEFQKKAVGKMQDVSRQEGRTVLFVSHNMAAVQNICTNCILIDSGSVCFKGEVSETIRKYLETNQLASHAEFEIINKQGNTSAKIKSISLKDTITFQNKSNFKMGDEILVELEFVSDYDLGEFDTALRMNDSFNNKIAAWRSSELSIPLSMERTKKIQIKIKKLNVFDGIYSFSISLNKKNQTLDLIENAIYFEITPAPINIYGKVIAKNNNLIYCDSEWYY